ACRKCCKCTNAIVPVVVHRENPDGQVGAAVEPQTIKGDAMLWCSLPLKMAVRRAASILMTSVVVFGLAQPAAADLWKPLGPDGGTVVTVAVDPGNDNTVYAGTPESGVWWSANGGRLWRRTGLGAPVVLWLGVA